MKTSNTFDFTTKDGRSISIEVRIDPKLIAETLAQKAWQSDRHKITACGKGVIVEVVRVQTHIQARTE